MQCQYFQPLFSAEILLHFCHFSHSYIRYRLSELDWSASYRICMWNCNTHLVNSCLLFLFESFSSCILTWLFFSVPGCLWVSHNSCYDLFFSPEMLASCWVCRKQEAGLRVRTLSNLQPQKSIHTDNAHLILSGFIVRCIFFSGIHWMYFCNNTEVITVEEKNIFERTLLFGIYVLLKLSK